MSRSASQGKAPTSISPQGAKASGLSSKKHTNTPDPSSGGTSTIPPLGNATGSYSNATSITPPQQVSEHVFLGVRRGMDYRVVDIEAQGLSDLGFFCTLKQRYAVLRGSWRLWFSWWRFSHCEFFMVCLAFVFIQPHARCKL